MARCPPNARNAIALLLDFPKAYDSLDRTFLYKVLVRHGYPSHFVQVIRKLHEDTTVRFSPMALDPKNMVTRGISQGCPLVPLLFILALEPLYQKLANDEVHHGVNLRTCADSVRQ